MGSLGKSREATWSNEALVGDTLRRVNFMPPIAASPRVKQLKNPRFWKSPSQLPRVWMYKRMYIVHCNNLVPTSTLRQTKLVLADG